MRGIDEQKRRFYAVRLFCAGRDLLTQRPGNADQIQRDDGETLSLLILQHEGLRIKFERDAIGGFVAGGIARHPHHVIRSYSDSCCRRPPPGAAGATGFAGAEKPELTVNANRVRPRAAMRRTQRNRNSTGSKFNGIGYGLAGLRKDSRNK